MLFTGLFSITPITLRIERMNQPLYIPGVQCFTNHRLNLGTWQGIYLCEFRNHGGSRKIVVTILS